MYVIWFKREFGGAEIRIECATVEDAQVMWDILISAGLHPQCLRP